MTNVQDKIPLFLKETGTTRITDPTIEFVIPIIV